MIQPDRPANDTERVRALRALDILDTPREERYDRITRRLTASLGVPISYVALVDEDRQWLKSELGGMPCEVGREASFCGHAILTKEPLIVADARKDPRFAGNPMVVGSPFLRFYAGFPLSAPGGQLIGTLCIADTTPRQLSRGEYAQVDEARQLIEAMINAKPHVFISYSHQDEAWKERLVNHLEVLQSQNLLSLWEDRQIDAGDTWRDEIQEAMEASSVAILLVSASFLSSRFVLDVEIPRLLRRRDQEGLRILPLIIKPCCWDCVPWLEPLNVLPKDAEPLSSKAKREIDGELARFSGHVLEQAQAPARMPTGRGPLPVPDEPIAIPDPRIEEEDDEVGVSATLRVVPPPKSAIRLTVRDKEAPGEAPVVQRFRQHRIAIGRNRRCDLVLRDPRRRVSGRHAEIVAEGEGFEITDLMSTNFTFVGGEQLEPGQHCLLASADVIEIGTFEITVEIQQPLNAQSTAEVTHLDLSFVNLLEEPVRQLGDLLRKLGTTYDAMAPGRREIALRRALTECLGDQSENPVLTSIGRFLDPS